MLQKRAQKSGIAWPLEEQDLEARVLIGSGHIMMFSRSFYHPIIFLNLPVASLKQAGMFTCGAVTA